PRTRPAACSHCHHHAPTTTATIGAPTAERLQVHLSPASALDGNVIHCVAPFRPSFRCGHAAGDGGEKPSPVAFLRTLYRNSVTRYATSRTPVRKPASSSGTVCCSITHAWYNFTHVMYSWAVIRCPQLPHSL